MKVVGFISIEQRLCQVRVDKFRRQSWPRELATCVVAQGSTLKKAPCLTLLFLS